MATHPKFKPPVFMHGRGAAKNTDHSAASGWLDGVVNALRAGTPAALKRISIAYHGNSPRIQDDLSAPIAARPSAVHAEPQDVPGVDPDQTRRLGPGNVATHPGTKGATPGPKVPTKIG